MPSNSNPSSGLKLQEINSESIDMESSIVTSRSQTDTKEKVFEESIEEIKGHEVDDDKPFDRPDFHFNRNKGLFKLAEKKYKHAKTDVPRTMISDIEISNIY